VAALEGDRARAAVLLLLRPHLRLLPRRPVGLNNLETVGVDNICFETDHPHTDTTWPNSKECVEKMVADAGLDDETAYEVLRSAVHAGARPRLIRTGQPAVLILVVSWKAATSSEYTS
jgi:hypothetical protein